MIDERIKYKNPNKLVNEYILDKYLSEIWMEHDCFKEVN